MENFGGPPPPLHHRLHLHHHLHLHRHIHLHRHLHRRSCVFGHFTRVRREQNTATMRDGTQIKPPPPVVGALRFPWQFAGIYKSTDAIRRPAALSSTSAERCNTTPNLHHHNPDDPARAFTHPPRAYKVIVRQRFTSVVIYVYYICVCKCIYSHIQRAAAEPWVVPIYRVIHRTRILSFNPRLYCGFLCSLHFRIFKSLHFPMYNISYAAYIRFDVISVGRTAISYFFMCVDTTRFCIIQSPYFINLIFKLKRHP